MLFRNTLPVVKDTVRLVLLIPLLYSNFTMNLYPFIHLPISDMLGSKRIDNNKATTQKEIRGCLHDIREERLFVRSEFTLVPSRGSEFVYMIPPEDVVQERVIPARA